jgi:hypothetical protein
VRSLPGHGSGYAANPSAASSPPSSALHRSVSLRPAAAVMVTCAMVMASAFGWMLTVMPSAQAQVPPSVSGFPAAVWAPVSVAVDLPPELQMTSLYLPPVTAGQGPSAVVGFAGAFQLPAGRWRVSVGVGNPNGVTVRTSLLWDGNDSVGVVERLDGLLVEDLGSVDVSVQASLVVIGLPDEVFGGALGDVLWVEAVLGEDSAPEATVRSDWYSRSSVFGEGAPGLVTGGSIGSVVGPDREAVGTGAEPVVVDTGAPATVQVTGDVAVVELAAPPASVAGRTVAEVVDVVTFSADPIVGTTGPQVRVNRTTGTVDLAAGTLGGPVSLNDDASVVTADPSWLPSGSPDPDDPANPAAGTLTVDLPGAFDQLGLSLPGDSLAVTITRVVTGIDGTQVLAAGMAADRSWLDQGAPVAPVTSLVEVTPAGTNDDSGLTPLILAGVVLGVVAVAGSIALSLARSRRKRANRPSDEAAAVSSDFGWTYDSTSSPASPPSAPETGPTDEPAHPGSDDVLDHESATEAGTDAAAGGSRPDPAPVPPADAGSAPLAALDDELEALERRLRRLGSSDG